MRFTIDMSPYVTIAALFFSSTTIVLAQNECTPCADGSDLNLVRTPAVCQEHKKAMEEQGPVDNTKCLTRQLIHYQDQCCDSAPQGLPGCDGIACDTSSPSSGYNPSIFVPNLDYENSTQFTCKDVATDDSFLAAYMFTPGQCDDTFRARSAAWCGCGDHCHLCPDGSNPTKPDRVDKLIYKWNCKSFQYFAALLHLDNECPVINDILKFDAAGFCGCAGLEETEPICKLCPEDQVLINNDQTQSKLEGNPTCADVEASVSFIATEAYCTETTAIIAQLGVTDTCCGSPSKMNDTEDDEYQPSMDDNDKKSSGSSRASAKGLASLFALLWAV